MVSSQPAATGQAAIYHERFVDSAAWAVRARAFGLVALIALLIATGTPLRVWAIPTVLAPLAFLLADRFAGRSVQPEMWGFAAWSVTTLSVGYAIAETGGARSFLAPWILVMAPGLLARYSSVRLILLGTGLIVATLLVAVFVGTPAGHVGGGLVVVSLILLLFVVTIQCWSMMSAETAQRAGAIVDGLTGMFNRKALDQRGKALDYQAAVTGGWVSVLMCDIDNFKGVNDTHGHITGDAVLKATAYCIRKQLRAFDTAFRLGGEEFLVLLAGSDATETATIAERIRAAVERFEPAGVPARVSIGVASAQGASMSVAELVRAADEALYVSKNSGRNRVTLGAVCSIDISTDNLACVRETTAA